MQKTPATPSDTLTILACQIDVPSTATVSERDAHLARSVEKVVRQLKATDSPIDLAVLPELSSINYSRETFENLSVLAEDLRGTSFEAWRQVARDHEVHIAYSFPRCTQEGTFISLAVVAPSGDLVGHYDKLHLAQYGASTEKEFFTRGNHLFVFEINNFRLAPIICYDIRIPELSRTLVVDHNVDVILHCGAYFRDESFHTWHPFVITRAVENQVYLLSLNRAGTTYGQSVFCPPWQDETTRPVSFDETKEDFRILSLQRGILADARHRYTFLQDRHEDYRTL